MLVNVRFMVTSKSKSQSKRPSFSPRRKRLSIRDKKQIVVDSFERLKKQNPDPKCELYYETPFQLLVSVVLSAQTTDKMVNRCMEPLYKKGFSPETVMKLGESGFLKKIKSIGLAPTKSKNVAKLTTIILKQHGGEVPDTREELEALPGVGRKTANVILGEIFGQPTIAVDTHVFRVSQRLGLHTEPTPEKCELKLLKLIDPKFLPQGHHWFILHGRYTCKSQTPMCDNCCLSDICPSATV